MPPRFIALLLFVISAAAITVWLLFLPGPGELLLLPTVFAVAALVLRIKGK